MSDQIVEEPAQVTDNPDQPTSDKEIDWKAEAEKQKQYSRTWEERAKANKAAADRLAEIEEQQKTAEQKAADRLAEAERLTAEANAKILRRDVALEHKLSTEDAALLDTITDETVMRSLAARLAPAPENPRAPHPDPNQRKAPTVGGTPGEQFADFLTRSLDQ